MKLSHQQYRVFQPDKLHPPRGFDNQVPALFMPSLDSKIVMEIGAGKGKHATEYASANPDDKVIAIERTAAKFAAFAKLVATDKLPNLMPIHADAIAWIVHAVPAQSLDVVYLLYPNPEPHNPNQQWLNMPFFEFLLSRLKDGGEVILATNIASYMDNAEQQAKQVWQLPSVRKQIEVSSQRTHFEIKYLARGETCWQLNMRKPLGYVTRFDAWTYQPSVASTNTNCNLNNE